MSYRKVMAEVDFMSTLYKNRRNLTVDYIRVIQYLYEIIEVKETLKFTILKFLKFLANY